MRLNAADFQLEGSSSSTLEAENFPTSRISFVPADKSNELVNGTNKIKMKNLNSDFLRIHH
jgi:hypothetical protein